MSIGIIVYSHTGHTLAVARKLEERLSDDRHAVTLEELAIVGPGNPSAKTARLKSNPPIDRYDALVFASPVNGGRMCGAMNSYLDQIPDLQGKRVVCLVTHFLFESWGANQTLDQMKDICESRGATICGTGSVRWSSFCRGSRISRTVEHVANCLANRRELTSSQQ